jgi:hypothetical protein
MCALVSNACLYFTTLANVKQFTKIDIQKGNMTCRLCDTSMLRYRHRIRSLSCFTSQLSSVPLLFSSF